MLKETQKPSHLLRLLAANVVLGFSAATFVILNVALSFIPLRYYLPSVAESLIAFLYALTGWTGIDIHLFQDGSDLIITLLLRFILLGTVVTALIFSVKPPKNLIARGALEKFSEANPFFKGNADKGIAYYYILISVFGIFGYLGRYFDFIEAITGNMDTSLLLLETICSLTATFLATIFLISVWSYGSKLANPVLKSDIDE